jgi:hypothetical protein
MKPRMILRSSLPQLRRQQRRSLMMKDSPLNMPKRKSSRIKKMKVKILRLIPKPRLKTSGR